MECRAMGVLSSKSATGIVSSGALPLLLAAKGRGCRTAAASLLPERERLPMAAACCARYCVCKVCRARLLSFCSWAMRRRDSTSSGGSSYSSCAVVGVLGPVPGPAVVVMISPLDMEMLEAVGVAGESKVDCWRRNGGGGGRCRGPPPVDAIVLLWERTRILVAGGGGWLVEIQMRQADVDLGRVSRFTKSRPSDWLWFVNVKREREA